MDRMVISIVVSVSVLMLLVAQVSCSSEKSRFLNTLQRSRRSPEPGLSGVDSPKGKSCVIEVTEVRRINGRCMRLLGGTPACQSDEWLDPINSYCREDDN